jgi:hypothetical protein
VMRLDTTNGLPNRSFAACWFDQRDRATTNAFMQDVASRMADRVQLSTDGFGPYPGAVRRAFGKDVDYGRIVKVYGTYSFGERRYSTSAERKYS